MSGIGGRVRRPAFWAIRLDDAGMWVVEEYRQVDFTDWGWRVRGEFPSGAEAIAAFAAGGR
jgi:hypothetical protein